MTIKEIRESKCLTQQQVADAVGISSTAYALIERGKCKLEDCKYKTVSKLVDFLGLEVLGGIIMDKKEIISLLESNHIKVNEKYLKDYNALVPVAHVYGQEVNLYRISILNSASYVDTEFSRDVVTKFLELCKDLSADSYVYRDFDGCGNISVRSWGHLPDADLISISDYEVFEGNLSDSDILEIEEFGFALLSRVPLEVKNLVDRINNSITWNSEDLAQLCEYAGISEEWEDADGENFESVAYKAAEILGVEI